jgi:hypothetical protein
MEQLTSSTIDRRSPDERSDIRDRPFPDVGAPISGLPEIGNHNAQVG